MIDGRTVMEIDPMCRSALEISELWRYLDQRMVRAEGGVRAPAEIAQISPAPGAAGRVFGRRAAS
jgi:chromosome partitioning protein